MQKNLILIMPFFVILILFNLGYAALKDGRHVNYGKSWTPVVISTSLPTATPTPGWWATGVISHPTIMPTPTGTLTLKGTRTK